ncbi:MAG: amidohydrolase [Clostridiales Family XIII bacterium]|jgi:5-methylthioadenosine/S-adenosylhomocysteine deaminase|nr:amidohydrolase [Clostridiales Family XIII bacterium]
MILFDNITLINHDGTVEPHAYVGVEGAQIAFVGKERPAGSFERVITGCGRILLPGFYNAHAHSPMTLMRGYGENLKLDRWLNDRIFPYEAELTGEAVYRATKLALAESFRSGIVSSSDMYYFCDDMIRAASETGAKMNVARALVMFDDRADPAADKRYNEALYTYKHFHGRDEGRILVDYALHAEYTSTPALVSAIASLAKETGTRVQVHVSETRAEHEECKARHEGKTPVQYLADLGLFDTPAVCAHCVWVEDEDRVIMREKGATAVSCPVSNLKLASGVCDVPALFAAGVPVAIGTDSVASNNSLNFIEEMKFFALLNKERHGDPTAVTPAETLFAATRAGALCQGRADCGMIAEGCRADIILIDASGPHMTPVYDACTNVVYSASGGDVCLTMIDGRIVYENGEYMTMDIEKVKAEAAESAYAIAEEVNG